MKKLLLVLFVASFVGLAFAFSPATVVNSPELNGTILMDDTTKTKKSTKTKKDCATKKECCKSKCTKSTKKKATKKKKS